MHVVGVVVVFRAKRRTMKQAHSGHAAHTHARTSNSTHEAHQQCLSECDAGHETGPVQCSRWRELNAKAGGARTTREDSQARHKTASPTGSLWNAMVLTRHGPKRKTRPDKGLNPRTKIDAPNSILNVSRSGIAQIEAKVPVRPFLVSPRAERWCEGFYHSGEGVASLRPPV